MLPTERAAPEQRRVFFDAIFKCCTYLPTLYNFLAGRILSDADAAAAEGRASVEQRLDAGVGVTPIGLMQSPTYAVLYDKSQRSFGKSHSLKCPHYIIDGGRCGVWRHRESTCATWFCKHVRGNTGYAFWREELHALLEVVEIGLARWCALEVLGDDGALKHTMASRSWKAEAEALSGDALDGQADREAYAKMWGPWRGREQEFFTACAARAEGLSWADILAICGPEAQARARLTALAYGRLLGDEVPERLKVASFEVIDMTRESARLKTYSEYDPIDVPVALLELLAYFDGRPTREALAAIASERGIQIEPGLVQKLADFQLLIVPT